ncbi:MAG: CBS domain-containing protein, partial [Betaproteobacteria bacterium]
MFAIYGISGPIFQGTLESLSRIPPVARRGRVNAVKPLDEQTETGFALEHLASRQLSAPGERAIASYQAMLPQELERGPLYHANQIMQSRVITVNADDEVVSAWKVLVDNQIHQAPVLDAGLNLVGIVSQRELLTALNIDQGVARDLLFKRVRDVMTTPVVAADAVTDIRRIARVMLDRNV